MGMKILGYDIETTGLDVTKDRIIEVGAVIWDVEDKVPLVMHSEFVNPGPSHIPLPDVIKDLTGIKDEWLQNYGQTPDVALNNLHTLCKYHDIKYILAHNGENYDKPLTFAELSRYNLGDNLLKDLPWIDTRSDLPFDREPISRRLNHLALDHGFMNPFPHRALFDVLTMLKVASKYDFQKVIEQSKIPWITVRALVDYDNREKAKEFRFSWENLGEKKYPKMWVKKIRENMLGKEQLAAEGKDFKVVQIE